MEAELDGEQRRLGDASKNLRKAERRIKELDFQAKIYIPNTIKTQKSPAFVAQFRRAPTIKSDDRSPCLRADMQVLKISAI